MAVYKRTYRGYSGGLTAEWSRFLVLYRHSRRTLGRSKAQTTFFNLCFLFPILCLLGIYANDHLSAFSFLGQKAGPLLSIDGNFFSTFLIVQSICAFILTAFIGPGLVSPDVANGAMTLYLCRPLSRREYVMGKLSVLVITLSQVTWIPGLVLFFVQGSLAGWKWMFDNWWLASGIFFGSWIWILSSSLLALALSAWVKRRFMAGAALLGVLFLGGSFAQAINSVLRTKQGDLINIVSLVDVVWKDMLRVSAEEAMPVEEAWFGILCFAAFCLYLLMKKVKANEVVR